MKRTAAVQGGLAGLRRLVMPAAGACALTTLILASLGAGDPPPVGAPPAAQSGAASTGAASGPSQAPETTSQPRFYPRSSIVIFPLRHADAESLARILQQLLAADAPAVVSDARTNCIIVSGGSLAIEKAKYVIAALDVPLMFQPVVWVPTRPASPPATQGATVPPTQAATGPVTRPSTGPVTRPATAPANPARAGVESPVPRP